MKRTVILFLAVIHPVTSFTSSTLGATDASWGFNSAGTCTPSRMVSGSVNRSVVWEVRDANNGDVNLVTDFLQKLRNFQAEISGEEPQPSFFKVGGTLQSLMPHVPNCHILFAQNSISGRSGRAKDPAGFASYTLKYAGFGPPYIHMEHLFVDSTGRSNGAGRALMDELAHIGKLHRCSHLEWSVAKHNMRGVQFYDRIGAKCTDEATGKSYHMKWVPAVWGRPSDDLE